MEHLRKPMFFAACALLGLVLMAEFGVTLAAPFLGETGGAVGWAIPTLTLLDIQLAFTAMLMAAPLLLPASLTGRIQGIATFIVALILVITSILAALAAFALFTTLITWLTAPGGQVFYLERGYANFPNGAAAATLAFIMACKLGSIGTLVLAHQRFLENKGFLLLMGTSLVATIIVSFLHGFVPGFLASVTDAIGAIIVAVVALVWAILGLIFGGIAVFKALA